MLTNGNWTYTWNGENRLIKAENSSTGIKVEFDYDYMGRRIFKKVYSGETLEKHLSFVYDGYKLIEERNALANNAAVRNYVWQPEALDRDVPLTVYDVASEKTYYYHTDANKNVTELSDENGGIVAHYEYSPFGSLTKVSGEIMLTVIPSVSAANTSMRKLDLSTTTTAITILNLVAGFHAIPLKSKVDTTCMV